MRHVLSLIVGVVLAFASSQFPEYSQQYVQRLGGAVDELQAIVADFDNAAANAGLSRGEAIGRYRAAGDPFLAERGTAMEQILDRYAYLSTLLRNVEAAGPVERAAWFPQFFDPEISARTIDSFRPAVPATAEGLAFTLGGLLIGYGLTSIIAGFLLGLFRGRRPVTIRHDTADY